jgi:cell division protein FtsL
MDALLERLSSGQIVAVISIVTGGIVALAMIVAIAKYQFQSLADDTALRHEKQQADLALRDRLLERREASGDKASVEELLALGMTAPAPDTVNTDLAKRFGMLDSSADEIERTLSRALAADPAQKKMILGVMDELLEYGADSSVILAAVRPLCATPVKAKPEPAAVA